MDVYIDYANWAITEFEGKVGAALKFLETHADNTVLPPTDRVIAKLQASGF